MITAPAPDVRAFFDRAGAPLHDGATRSHGESAAARSQRAADGRAVRRPRTSRSRRLACRRAAAPAAPAAAPARTGARPKPVVRQPHAPRKTDLRGARRRTPTGGGRGSSGRESPMRRAGGAAAIAVAPAEPAADSIAPRISRSEGVLGTFSTAALGHGVYTIGGASRNGDPATHAAGDHDCGGRVRPHLSHGRPRACR